MLDKNLAYANPVLSFYIYNIIYEDGKIEDKNYIRKNIWENKY